MNEISGGLLEPAMMKRLTQHWLRSEVGLMYVTVPDNIKTSREILRDWASGEQRVLWECNLNEDAVYALCTLSEKESLESVLKEASAHLLDVFKSSLDDGSGASAAVAAGTAKLPRNESGMLTEAAVFIALKEAAIAADRIRLKGVQKAEQTYQETEQAYKETAVATTYAGGHIVPIASLASNLPQLEPHVRVSEVAELFDANPNMHSIVIEKDGVPLGLMMRENLYQLLARQYGMALYWNRPVERMMDAAPLIVDASLSVEAVSQQAMARESSQLYDVVIITDEGRYIGGASIRSILECITSLRTEEARSANPLTNLPGGDSIRREMERRIDRKKPFSAIYVDLDYFKWFNDCYGYSLGNEMIRYTASVLSSIIAQYGEPYDFVGHIGGDDFILVTSSQESEHLCNLMIERFDRDVKSFYDETSKTGVVDRQGNPVDQDGVTISMSLMNWNGELPVTPDQISSLAAKLKKQAKAIKGSSFVASECPHHESQHGEGR